MNNGNKVVPVKADKTKTDEAAPVKAEKMRTQDAENEDLCCGHD